MYGSPFFLRPAVGGAVFGDAVPSAVVARSAALSGGRQLSLLRAFGLLAGADNEVVSGPGVLRIGMELSLINADGEKTSKVITATHNICAAINNAGLTEIEDDPEKRVQSTKEASISIGETLDIDATAVMAGDSNGITGWDEAEIEFDI